MCFLPFWPLTLAGIPTGSQRALPARRYTWKGTAAQWGPGIILAITGHIFCDGVHVPSRWILDAFNVLLLVLTDVVNGRSVLEQMQLVFIHSSCSLQDVSGTLNKREGFLGADCDPPDIMAQIILADV